MRIMPISCKYVFILFTVITNSIVLADKYVTLTSNGPIVKGGSITFEATAYDNGKPALGQFEFIWVDDAIPRHFKKVQKSESNDSWTVTYEDTIYPIGIYEVQVTVKTCVLEIICYDFASNRHNFVITDTLNGKLDIIQGKSVRDDVYVSNNEVAIHKIKLNEADSVFVKNATRVLTYWFVDCVYYGFTEDFKFKFNYSNPSQEYTVEALLTADFTPLPPTTTVPPSTTTTKATTTTSKPTTSTKPTTTTTIKPTTPKNANSTIKSKKTVKRNVNTQEISKIMYIVNGTKVHYNVSYPFICNATKISADPKLTYGYYKRKVIPEEPIINVSVTGNNWLQKGSIMKLNVKCKSTSNMQFCMNFYEGFHNATQNETCSFRPLTVCDFPLERYYTRTHTVVIVIKNDVSKIVQPVTVTIYEVQTQAQLSVIVVPVAFSLVAVVLIVFGVAYYIQNRQRFVVEVADFNFGQQYSDMEYKTFTARLRDSISEAFTRDPSPGSSDAPVWPPGRKYGSMT